MWKHLLNWVMVKDWNSLEDSEDWKMKDSVELPRDILNCCAQNTDSYMDSKVQTEVSERDEKH